MTRALESLEGTDTRALPPRARPRAGVEYVLREVVVFSERELHPLNSG